MYKEYTPQKAPDVSLYLEKFQGIHPRILLNDSLKNSIKNLKDSVYRDFLKRMNYIIQTKPQSYYVDKSDAFELWQRAVGDTLSGLSFAYAVTGEQKYLKAAQEWALAACEYPCWGRAETDLAMGHQLFGMSVFYDWCFDGLSKDVINKTEKVIKHYYSLMLRAAETDGYWREWNLQNHMWINMAGLGAAGIVLYDKYPETKKGIYTALQNYLNVMASLGHDGASHEGIAYWNYGIQWLMIFMLICKQMFDIDMFSNSEWFKNTGYYRIYLGLPLGSETASSSVFDIADSARCDSQGPCGVLDCLAKQYNDGYIASYCDYLRKNKLNSDSGTWFNVIGRVNPPVHKDIKELPLLRYFNDMEIVSARSSWDADAGALVFKCGPFIGHDAMNMTAKPPFIDWGGGHVHQDANHFSFYGNGEFLIRDDGYIYKTTDSHNTLLINGKGQQGGDGEWFRGAELLKRNAQPYIKTVKSSRTADYMAGEAAQAYAPELGVKSFCRHLVFVKPNKLFVIDDISLEKDAEMELRLFPESDTETVTEQGMLFLGKNTKVLIQELVSDGSEFLCEDVRIYKNINRTTAKKKAIRIKKYGNSWRHVTAVQFLSENHSYERMSVNATEDGFRLCAGNSIFKLNTEKETLETEDDIANIFVNGNKVRKNDDMYIFDTEKNGRCVREGYNSIKADVIPFDMGAEIAVKRPENGFGVYEILVNKKTYRLEVKGSPFCGKKIPIKSISASKTSLSNPPECVLDENRNTYWAAEGDEHWIKLELNECMWIEGIDISWYKGAERISWFEIETSDDSGSKTFASKQASGGLTDYPEYYKVGSYGKFIKIICRGNTQGRWNSIIDVGVYTICGKGEGKREKTD